MKKVINGLFAAVMLVAVGQAVCAPVARGKDVQRLKALLAAGSPIIMPGADLKNADLSGADLSNADFTRADLRDANLSNANLTNVILLHAKLSGANFAGVTGLFPGQKDDARRQGALNVPD